MNRRSFFRALLALPLAPLAAKFVRINADAVIDQYQADIGVSALESSFFFNGVRLVVDDRVPPNEIWMIPNGH